MPKFTHKNSKPAARASRRAYMKSPKGRMANRKAQSNYRSGHPEKVRAQKAAQAAGTSGHRCAKCGKPAKHKHHTSYSKGTIQWLCHPHHVKAHHPQSNLGDGMDKSRSGSDPSRNAPRLLCKDDIRKIRKGGSSPESLSKPSSVVRTKADEARWSRAQAAAKKQGQGDNQRLIMHIYQAMAKSLSASLGSLQKSLYEMDDEWCMRFMGSPFAADALSARERYLRKKITIAKKHEAARTQRDAIVKQLDGQMKSIREQRTRAHQRYEAGYDELHALREQYEMEKSELLVKLAGWEREKIAGMAKSHGASMSNIYDEIRNMDVEALLKADGKPGRPFNADKGTKEDKTNEPKAAKEDGSDDSEMDKGVPSMPMGDAGGGMAKSLVSGGEGEPTSPGIGSPASDGSNAPGDPVSSGHEFNSDPMSGMPSEPSGPDTHFSDDDVGMESQLKDADPAAKPLADGSEGGAAELDRTIEQHYGKAAMSKSHESLSVVNSPYVHRGPDMQNVGVGVSRTVPTAPSIESQAAGESHVWAQGKVMYSNYSDNYIAKAMNEKGEILVEPTFGPPASPLTTAHACVMCKSMVPNFLTTCPECGVGEGEGVTGGVIMEKSVAQSMRAAPNRDLFVPAGVKLTEE